MAAYDRGRDLERAEVGIVLDASGLTPPQARRLLREMFPRLKQRCQQLSTEVPGAVSGIKQGIGAWTTPRGGSADAAQLAFSRDRTTSCF